MIFCVRRELGLITFGTCWTHRRMSFLFDFGGGGCEGEPALVSELG